MITNNCLEKNNHKYYNQTIAISKEMKSVTMKAIIILVFICIGYCSTEYVTTLGDCTNYTLVGRDRVYAKAYKDKIRSRTIKFPKVSSFRKFLGKFKNRTNVFQHKTKYLFEYSIM